MSKLFKLKKYLTIEDAARYLSSSLEELVSVADIYELALDNELMVSVRFIDQAYATCGRYASSQDDDINQLQIEKDKWLVFDKQVHVIDGVWDLAMIGIESHTIKELYQKEVDGPEPIFSGVNGFFLKQGELLYKLQMSLPLCINDNRAALEERLDLLLKAKGLVINDISNDSYALDSLSESELDEFMLLSSTFMEIEGENLVELDDQISLENPNYQYVIRTNELTRFVQALDDEYSVPGPTDKPLGSKERNTLLTMIGVLSEEANIDLSARGISASLQALMDQEGIPMSDDTIRKVIYQVGDAMERRRK